MGLGNSAFRSNTQVSGGWLFKFLNLNDAADEPSGGVWHDGSWTGPVLDYGGQVINVKHPRLGDGGAKGDGASDDTAAFVDAITLATAGTAPKAIYVPAGTYVVSSALDGLNVAGLVVIGESKWKSVIQCSDDYTDSYIFGHPNAASGTSAYVRVEGIKFDLNGIDTIAVDLSSCNNSRVRDCLFQGGTSLGTATGTGVKFGAPLSSGAYSNVVEGCHGRYLAKGVEWGVGANINGVVHCELLNCTVGLDADPGGAGVDTPSAWHVRIEGCTTGLKEGGDYGTYGHCRFESNTTDISFGTNSLGACFVGGYTAGSSTILNDVANAVDLVVVSSELGGHRRVETSTSRPIHEQGLHLLSAPGAALPTKPSAMDSNYTAYFDARALFRNNVAAYWLLAGGTVIPILNVNGSDVVQLAASTSGTTIQIGNASTVNFTGAGTLQGAGNTFYTSERHFQHRIYTVATLPAATGRAGQSVYVSDDTGGATLAFSNGTNWVRVSDLATVTT